MKSADQINGIPTVICAVCGTYFTHGVIGKGQAGSCASCCSPDPPNYVSCHYGSDRDMDIYKWIGGVITEGWVGADPICGACVTAAVNDGRLKYYGDMGEVV